MPDSTEHKFIASCVQNHVERRSNTRLFGLTESDRRLFDYTAIVHRDFRRTLSCQVLWSHEHGIQKDIATLITDNTSDLKVYLARDTIKSRAAVLESIKLYQANENTIPLLRGLRVLWLPSDFDADQDLDRLTMESRISETIDNDIIFRVIFGGLTRSDFSRFFHSTGVFGLKVAILWHVIQAPIEHTPTFKARLQYKTTGSIDKCLIALSSLGLVSQPGFTKCCYPTPKGRALLDVLKLLTYEYYANEQWSSELVHLFNYLGVPIEIKPQEPITMGSFRAMDLLMMDILSAKKFNADLHNDIDKNSPKFFSDWDVPSIDDRILSADPLKPDDYRPDVFRFGEI